MAAADVLNSVKKKVKNVSDAYKAGSQESSSLGSELGAKKEMMDKASQALKPTSAPAPKPSAPSAPSPADKINRKYGDRPGEKVIDTSGMTKPLGSFHKGGKVKKSGVYALKKGEKVLTAGQQKRSSGVLGSDQHPASGSSPDDMHIQKLDDGSFSVAHSFNSKGVEPSKPPKKFSAKNAKHLVKHVRAAYNAPPESEPDMDDAQ